MNINDQFEDWGLQGKQTIAAAQARWLKGSQGGNVVGVLAFDLSSALDNVDKAQLIPKLAALGIKGTALSWCDSYISGGRQCADRSGTQSSFADVKFGVRQGSILGPCLFLVLMADLPDCLRIGEESNVGYADDVSIWAEHPEEAVAAINRVEVVKDVSVPLKVAAICAATPTLHVMVESACLGKMVPLTATPDTGAFVTVVNDCALDLLGIAADDIRPSQLKLFQADATFFAMRRRRIETTSRPSPDPALDESDDEPLVPNPKNPGQFQAPQLPDELERDSDSALEEETSEVAEDTGSVANQVIGPDLAQLPPRWRNWCLRAFSGFLLISGFSILIAIGPIGLIFLTYLVMFSAYSEVMGLAIQVCKAGHLRFYSWYNFYCLQYFLNAPQVYQYVDTLVPKLSQSLQHHHHLISFGLYMLGMVYFVLQLDHHYMRSYSFLAWSHMTLLFFAVPGQILNHLTMKGMIWYILPMTLITLNDIMAFYVGFFFGRTPLIKLSPKKTWEGFVFGGLLTVIFGVGLLHLMVTPYLICPVQINPMDMVLESMLKQWTFPLMTVDTHCDWNPIFNPQTYEVLGRTLELCPMLAHGLVLCAMFSAIGPFGGFMASGFKRGCKRKNFGGFIPGHGGVTDRCDCMFLCAVIMHVYYKSFIEV
eukprot:maker-scaffold327_size205035-snap-gene-1.10 protein:Tk05415 transcript:maker-scaffold327_size205035-snap-gene-1.10-mRNA-1 annotation:"phosphatidate photoreceptor-specific"